MTFYNTIFKESWAITKRHKTLWLFGLFVLFWGGKGIDLEVFFTNAKLLQSPYSPFRPEFWQVEKWLDVAQQLFPGTFSLAGLVLFVLVVALFVLALIIFSQVGLVDAFRRYGGTRPAQAATGERYSVTDAIDAGRIHFVPVLAVNIIGKGVSYGAVALASSPLFLAQFESTQILYTALLFLVLTPLAVLVSMLTKYAVNDIVLNNHNVGQAMVVAWRTFAGNVGVSIELAVFMLLAYAGVNIAAIVVALILTLPVYFFGAVLFAKTGSVIGVGLFQVYLYVVAAITITVSSIAFSAWHYGNWTLLFTELTSGKKRSKIHRIWYGE